MADEINVSDMVPADSMVKRMSKGWRSGLPLTSCGSGSLPENTAEIRVALPVWSAKYGLRTVCDAGAGDMVWRLGMEWDVDYRPFDLIPRLDSVARLDISTELLPECDLILCRWVLNHLDPVRVEMALNGFRKSGKYLAATQFDGGRRSRGHLDLRSQLGEQIESVPDSGVENCTLSLWRLHGV